MKYIKTFEEGVYGTHQGGNGYYLSPDGNFFKKSELTKLLCINNKIGELKYNLTIGKIYKIKKFVAYAISVIDDSNEEQFFNPAELSKYFSTEKNYEDYLTKKEAEKYNL